jgi:phosphopantothenoylcysteine decarboxylase / phosphopantothenate---cysteine ligase
MQQSPNNSLKSKRIIITAGPTREAIDPVRFISNHSTGKMGYAIAEYLHSLGADVHVVSGPVNIKTSLPAEMITNVVTADEMLEATQYLGADADVIIFSAAVADYKCAAIASQKIKKQEGALHISLVPNPDIAFELSKTKKPGQLFVGFALETENGVANAVGKMQRKKFDFVVLNIQDSSGSGFGFDTNRIKLIDSELGIRDCELKLKSLVAVDIVNHLMAKLPVAVSKQEMSYA